MRWFQNLLVGVMFFGAMAIVAHFTIFSASGPFARRGHYMVLYFENADGIKAGSKVTVLGVPTGSVKDIVLVPVDRENRRVVRDSPKAVAHMVAVTIEIRNPFTFYENYRTAIKSESLLSAKLVAIDPGSAMDRKTGKRWKKINVFMISALRMADMKTSVLHEEFKARQRRLSSAAPYQQLRGETSSDPVAGIASLIEENRTNVRRTISNITSITNKINQGKGTVGALINDDALHRNAGKLLTDAQIVLKELRESLEDTREQAPVTSFLRSALTAF